MISFDYHGNRFVRSFVLSNFYFLFYGRKLLEKFVMQKKTKKRVKSQTMMMMRVKYNQPLDEIVKEYLK